MSRFYIKKIKFEYAIVSSYLIIGGLWIAFSDKLLMFFVNDPDLLTKIQTFKGLFYVLITAILFYLFLKRHLEKLRHAEQVAKESDKLKTSFIQNISHEIRTPMNGIIGFTELLNNKDLSDEDRFEYLELIHESSNQLLNIVNEVLDMSLIETGNMKINKKDINLNKLMEDIYTSFKLLIKKDIEFSLKNNYQGQADIVKIDDVKLRQILTNIINNAIKFTDKGFVSFGYNKKSKELEFFVEDTGLGIEPDFQKQIFNRFLKATNSNNRLYEGIGLGLAISKGLIDLLNGKIWIKSEVGKGSTFFFSIPYEPADETDNVDKNDGVTDKKFNNLLVLVAEDDDLNYLYLKEIFKNTGIELIRAKNGKEAVDICSRIKNIGIILMDLKMPVMDGYEAIVQITKAFPDLPIIAQTAYALNDEKQKAFDAGCIDYISKPFKKEPLLSMIEKYQKK
jgi:signal transduction histidine kinase